MIHLIGIGPGDPELLTLKAARILGEADIIYAPRSDSGRRSIADGVIAPHAAPGKIRRVPISMRSPEPGADPVYAALAVEMADEAQQGKRVAYVSIGDTLLYSTGQYLGRELSGLGVQCEYVSGIPSFIAAAALAGMALASGREELLVSAMPDSLEKLDELAARADTLALLKVDKRLPILMEYAHTRKPAKAELLHRIGLENQQRFDLTATPDAPEGIGYLSIALLRREQA